MNQNLHFWPQPKLQADTRDGSSFVSDHFKSVSAASQSNRTPGTLMHRKHMRANASPSDPMPRGSNCFYLWWFPNHVWWGAWVVPCLAACERVNGGGLIAINCACVAFALMQPSHGAAGLYTEAIFLIRCHHRLDWSDWVLDRCGQLLWQSWRWPPACNYCSYGDTCGYIEHRTQLHRGCSGWIDQTSDCNYCLTPKSSSIKHIWLQKQNTEKGK